MIKIIYKSITTEKFNVFMLCGAVILIVVYIVMANSVAMANYRKTALQKNIDGLRLEIKTLNLELTDKRSIGFLKKAAGKLNLVINESIQYIKVVGPVAKNP